MFATFTTVTANAIASTESLITDLQQQLEAARQELAQLQQQQQAEQTAKSAAETALEMVRKARKLVQIAYGDAAVEEFNRVLVENEPVGELAPGEEQTEAEPTPEDLPSDPTTVTVEAEAVEEEAEPQATAGEEGGSRAENALDFSRLSWTKLQRLAASKGVAVKGKRKDAILDAIAQLNLTQADIDSVA